MRGEEEETKRRRRGPSTASGASSKRWRRRSTPANNFADLAAQIEGAPKGKQRGGRGLYIGGVRVPIESLNRRQTSEESTGTRARFSVRRLRKVTSLLMSAIFLFLYFLFSIITFEIELQIKSNKFVKICKIQYSLF